MELKGIEFPYGAKLAHGAQRSSGGFMRGKTAVQKSFQVSFDGKRRRAHRSISFAPCLRILPQNAAFFRAK